MFRCCRAVLPLAAGALGLPAALTAQPDAGRPVAFGLSAGLAAPVGALADFTHAGYTIKALAQSSPAFGGIALRGELAYTSLAGDRRVAGPATFAYSNTHVFGGTLDLVLTPGGTTGPPRTRLYFLGGLGLYRFDYGNAAQADGPNDKTVAGVNLGAGLRFPLGPVRAFVEARYHNGFGTGNATRFFQPLTFGLVF